MTDAFVQLNPDSTGKRVDTSELVVASNTVERQRMVVADDTDPAGLSHVTNSVPGVSDYGQVTRPVINSQDLFDLTTALWQLISAMPRRDTAGRVIVNTGDQGSQGNILGIISTVNSLGTSSKFADAMPLHVSNAATVTLYQNIIVS